MKTIQFITILMFTLSTSCIKKYNCLCSSIGTPQLDAKPQVYRDTKKNAQAKCKDYENQVRQASVPDVTCNID
jgi:hypothetical protein